MSRGDGWQGAVCRVWLLEGGLSDMEPVLMEALRVVLVLSAALAVGLCNMLRSHWKELVVASRS